MSARDWSKVNSENLVRRRQQQHEEELIQSTATPVLRSFEERRSEQELERWVKRYEGTNSFVCSLKARLNRPGYQYLTASQAATAFLIRAEGRTGIRKPWTKRTPKPKVNATRQRGQNKQRANAAYQASKLVIKRTDTTGS